MLNWLPDSYISFISSYAGNHMPPWGHTLLLVLRREGKKRILWSRVNQSQVTSPLMASWIRFQNIKAKDWYTFISTYMWKHWVWVCFVFWIVVPVAGWFCVLSSWRYKGQDITAILTEFFCTACGYETGHSHVYAPCLQQVAQHSSFSKCKYC